jgi:Raf kinase inhibitor-like YbhB/YbcL family protein
VTDTMHVMIDSWKDSETIPDKYSFCIPAEENHVALGENISPAISWSGAPDDTASFVILCTDPGVPTDIELVNKEDKKIPVDTSRFTFFHWVLADIPVNINQLAEGAESDGIQPGGKDFGKTNHGNRGINFYTNWFANDEQMKGQYGGYDGPCPPWNDELVHKYYFTVYALDIDTLNLDAGFTGPDVERAMQGHILAQGTYLGTYSLNPNLR